jgi:hypothetical protein
MNTALLGVLVGVSFGALFLGHFVAASLGMSLVCFITFCIGGTQ